MKSVIKGTSYILAHVPDMLIYSGTTQSTERILNPKSEYLEHISEHIRSYEEALAYLPNQVYIGNLTPGALSEYEQPWYEKKYENPCRYGSFGEIMPQDEFLLLMKACDAFDLVRLSREFIDEVKPKLEHHPFIGTEIISRIGDGVGQSEIERYVKEMHAEPLFHLGRLVGYVRRAHDVDENLSAHVMLENIASKATCVLSLLHLIHNAGIAGEEIDYVIECSEEACGDMNQRGGGNFAKAAAEAAGLKNATGCDIRAFCAAPVHGIIAAASLVSAGTYKNIAVTAGGCAAKLGMNGKDHVKKGIPVLEDVLGGFAVLVSRNDGISPEIDLKIAGRHTVGTGSSPQAVITSLVTEPLDRAGLKITDIDRYSVEMQNPDITKPAGAGDIPLSNYKMIGALAVKRQEIKKEDIAGFVNRHGMVGWAPTQGHIPSGVPYLGFACREILEGSISKAMIIGKGSLFLGRMTNLFDGVSFVIHKNSGIEDENGVALISRPKPVRVVVSGIGSEHGEETVIEGIRKVNRKDVEVLYIGTLAPDGIRALKAETGEEAHKLMESMLDSGEADCAVAMHYTFPIGVATIGRLITPGKGKEMFIASTTGTSSVNRVEAMVRNAVYGIITARACGIEKPAVGILNLDGARQVENALKQLKKNGFDINFAASGRSDGGCIMRGNDILSGECDIMVCDSLTGNVIMKLLSSYTTGGTYESSGYGYGPGIGENYERLIMIVSRASGAPVIAGAIEYASQLVEGRYRDIAARVFAEANSAGLKNVISDRRCILNPDGSEKKLQNGSAPAEMPAREPVTCQISGVDIMELEDAVKSLQEAGIYAESGMGCTGPVILVSEANADKAVTILKNGGWITEG